MLSLTARPLDALDSPQETPVPYDETLERALLRGLILEWQDPQTQMDALAVVSSFLEPAHFYWETHGWIYQAIRDLWQAARPVDYTTLAGELRARRTHWAGREQTQLDALGGDSYLSGILSAGGGGSGMAEYYARDVEALAARRALITVGGQIAGLGYSTGQDLPTVLGRAESLLRTVTDRPGQSGFTPITERVLTDHLTALDTRQHTPATKGLPTGISALDRVIRWRKGQFIVPAARPSEGKTALVLGFALAAAQAGKSVGIASLEMDTDEILDRFLAMAGGAALHDIRMADVDAGGWQALNAGKGRLSSFTKPLHLLDAAGLTVPQLRGKAYQLAARAGLDLLIVDYLQLMEPVKPTANRVRDLGEITRGLKNLARELHVPLIAPSQLSRAVEGRADRVPQLSDLRESGSIENDADVVLFIYRPDPQTPAQAELHIRKHRNGPTGTIPVYWQGRNVQFYGEEDE
jgi:replicative DNA helicase